MGRSFRLVVILGSLLIMLAKPAVAETVPVSLGGDEVHYDYGLQQIEASGNVEISYKDINIQCEQALIDQTANVILATGKVIVDQNGDIFRGERFLYYIQQQQGWLEPLSMVITDTEIKGQVLLNASDADLKGEAVRLKKAFFSSCELEEPHFQLTAAEIEYFPEDRIIFHRVWYWEGKLRLLYLPYLAVSLKNKENNFEAQVGQTGLEGWYLSVGYNYFLNDASYGKVKFRTTEYGGDGIGVEHTIEGSPTSKWRQEYFVQDNSDHGIPYQDYMYSLGYENWSNPKGKVVTSLENWLRNNQYGENYQEKEYNFNYYGISPYPNIYFHFTEDGETTRRLADLAGRWNYKPDPSLDYNFSGRWYSADTLDDPFDAQSQFRYDVTTRKDWGWSNARLYYSEARILSGNYTSYNFKPDLTYTIPNWQFPGLGKLMLTSQFTKLEKYPSSDSGQRLALDIQKPQVLLWQNEQKSLNIHTSGSMRYRSLSYIEQGIEDDDSLTALIADLGLTNNFTKNLSTTVSMGLTEIAGEIVTNDFFSKSDNRIQPGGFVSNDWRYYNGKWDALLRTGYNFYSQSAQPVDVSINWLPAEQSRFEFNTIYYWELGLGQSNFNLHYAPKEKWSLVMYLGYNFLDSSNPWTRREFEAMVEDKLSKNWRYQLAARFDPFEDGFSIGQVNMIYDWHCRELVFHFDWVEQEYWVKLNIKAFPQAQVKFGTNPMEYFQE